MPTEFVFFSGSSNVTDAPSSSVTGFPSLHWSCPSTGDRPLPPQPARRSINDDAKTPATILSIAGELFRERIHFAIVAGGVPPQVGRINGDADHARAAIDEDKLAN